MKTRAIMVLMMAVILLAGCQQKEKETLSETPEEMFSAVVPETRVTSTATETSDETLTESAGASFADALTAEEQQAAEAVALQHWETTFGEPGNVSMVTEADDYYDDIHIPGQHIKFVGAAPTPDSDAKWYIALEKGEDGQWRVIDEGY